MNVNDTKRERKIYKVTIMGGIANAILLIFKFIAGFLGHSSAMIADAVHSLSDFLTDIVILIFVKISNKPADKNHDYGHGKFETLATFIIGVVLLAVGIMIFWSGASKIFMSIKGIELEQPGMLAFWAAIVSIIVKEAIARYTIINGRRLNSKAVEANAWHHRSDALSSVGAAAGIAGAIFLGPKWRILDPLAAVVVSIFILIMAVKFLVSCISEFMEHSLSEDIENEIINTVMSFEFVKNVHNLRTRKIGNGIAMDMHVVMDGDLTLEKSHQYTKDIENLLRSRFGDKSFIYLHVEPSKKD
ncbi:MAG TPA: cation diffusion facilitator family transporter [Bacteroidetes bacterium]|mgnify:CR=1 FL=1|nr:cation diffusion facilitator family transporter [Candidatus Limimorpha avicola]